MLSGVVLLILLGGPSIGQAQDEEASGAARQAWANLTLGKTVNEKTYLEFDIEPKIQVTSGEEWHNVDFTPLLEYYPSAWIDLTAEATVGVTRQHDGLDTLEATPRIGARFHFFEHGVRGTKLERLPLRRLGVSTLVRLEWRNFYYSDDRSDGHEWRGRLRLESKLALNRAELGADKTLYAIADVEYYAPLSDDIDERYVNKLRLRLGLGYRISPTTRLELLYIRDWNRESSAASSQLDTEALDLRVKLFF